MLIYDYLMFAQFKNIITSPNLLEDEAATNSYLELQNT
jgi:hypothetical protein